MTATMMTYIHQQSTVLPRIIQEYTYTLNPLSEFIQNKSIKKILLLAAGSSYNAALCTRYYFMQHCGIIVDIKEPYNFTHYEPTDSSFDLAIAISQSGKSSCTLSAQQKVQAAGIPVFSLTSNPHSPLAKSSDGVIDLNTGIESVGFVTLGFTATVINLLLIAAMMGINQGKLTSQQHQYLLTSLNNMTDKITEVIRKTEKFIDHHHDILCSASRFIAISYGALQGVAEEFATKFTETVRLPSSGFGLEAYMHGPYLEANPQHVLFFIEDKENSRLHALRDYMQPHVHAVMTVNAAASQSITDGNTLSLNLSIDHHFASVLLIIPLQVMAWRVASMKNIDLAVAIFTDFDDVLRSKI